jgi:uncharacterized short protein YbdD (DUF466 family)
MRVAGRGSRVAGVGQQLVAVARRVTSIVRAVLGAPDYQRYVEHIRTRHPGEVPLSAREFARRRMEARYDTPGSRCC